MNAERLFEALLSSELFEQEFYQEAVGRVFSTRAEAARHYLDVGQQIDIEPSPHFDSGYYKGANPDIVAAGLNPFQHFLLHGLGEGRRAILSRSPRAVRPTAPAASQWEATKGRFVRGLSSPLAAQDDDRSVDVVIPAYRGFDDTLACIESVCQSTNVTPYRLIVIDDCGPDPALSDALEKLATSGIIMLIRNATNLGFVGTANLGIALSGNRDVILLNSDTVVYGNWIDRLRRHAYAKGPVATVTPLSNNATICSYPYFCESNNQKLEIDFETVDTLACTVNHGLSTVVPTGVGFCFYMRRAAVDDIGVFNQDLFKKGYGEENDYCMRAADAGWINLAALDIFVRHTGEVSFGGDAGAGKKKAYERLTAAHPRYETLVGECLRRDPLRPGREAIDIARFARTAVGRRGVLMVQHSWGGGVDRHVQDLANLIASDGVPALVSTMDKTSNTHPICHGTSDDYPNLPSISWFDEARSVELLEALGIGIVHIHSLVGSALPEIRQMLRVLQSANIACVFTIHDYAPVCPRLNLIDWSGSFCNNSDIDYCRVCLDRTSSLFGVVDIDDWLETYRLLMESAQLLMVPHQDVANRLRDRFDLPYPFRVKQHASPKDAQPVVIKRTGSLDRSVGIIGAIGPHKGSAIVQHLCTDAIQRGLPIRYTVFGYVDFNAQLYRNLTVTGRYRERELPYLIEKTPVDLALLPSLWPETFCYALDYAFDHRIFPIVFDMGAQATRVRDVGFGAVLPLDAMFNPSAINDFIMNIDLDTRASPKEEPQRRWISAQSYYEGLIS